MTFRPFSKVTWMDLYSEFHDRWLWTDCNWVLVVVLLDLQMYQKRSATLYNLPLHTPSSQRQFYHLRALQQLSFQNKIIIFVPKKVN